MYIHVYDREIQWLVRKGWLVDLDMAPEEQDRKKLVQKCAVNAAKNEQNKFILIVVTAGTFVTFGIKNISVVSGELTLQLHWNYVG